MKYYIIIIIKTNITIFFMLFFIFSHNLPSHYLFLDNSLIYINYENEKNKGINVFSSIYHMAILKPTYYKYTNSIFYINYILALVTLSYRHFIY